MTLAAGGVAVASARATAPSSSKLPNAARPKKGKTSAKKNKAADGSGTSKARRKKFAGRATGAAATEAPASSLVEPAADAHNMFDEMPPSLNDDAYMSTMGVGSNNSHCSQTNDMHFENHEFKVDEEGEGIVDAPRGRAGNYTNTDDILLCNTWLQVSREPSVGGDQSRDDYWLRMKEHFDVRNVSGIDRSDRSLRSRWSTINSDCQRWAACQKAVDKLNPSGTNEDDRYNITQNLFKEEERKTKKGKIKKGRIFTLPHCYEVLKDDEKWKKREDLDDLPLSNKRKQTIKLDDDEDDASSDDGKRSPTPNSVSYSKPKNQDAAAEERRLAAEERRVAAEERKVALEERKVSNEERTRLLEWEKHLFFLDTSILNEVQKEYVNLACEEVLIQKRTMIRAMGGGGLGAMGGGGICAMGGMGGFGGTMGGAMGAMAGFGAPPDAMATMGGMGAPPAVMGGMSFNVPPRTHSHEDAVEDLANIIGASRDAVRDEEREEDSSSEAEESSSEDQDEDEDEDEE
ncbi:hypothetical protein CFC21_016631 [Triticum aestivum]|uniref:Uncharacterized protein n=2 Tax=Triticum aestivum TaxID=4565 RepID=A0A3B6AX08_WHEAT|nr:hypothetical protein CFC21_016631 [Triticum aestivum]